MGALYQLYDCGIYDSCVYLDVCAVFLWGIVCSAFGYDCGFLHEVSDDLRAVVPFGNLQQNATAYY